MSAKRIEDPIFLRLRTESPEAFFSSALPNIDIRDNSGGTLLHQAIAFKKLDIAGRLIGLENFPINAQDKNGQTALHYAAIYGQVDIARLILENGGNPNIADSHGNNALWTSALAAKGDLRLVRLVLAAGGDATHKNKAGRSVLDFAQQSQNRDLLILCGGDGSAR